MRIALYGSSVTFSYPLRGELAPLKNYTRMKDHPELFFTPPEGGL